MKKKMNDEDWRKKLEPQQYSVLRKKSTEIPFTGKLLHNKDDGSYRCAGCGTKLFDSKTKFDSGTGWPSFYDANMKNIELREDNSHFMHRTEVVCKKCGGHLGHLFDDGPKEIKKDGKIVKATGKRFCINSCALDFKKKGGKK